MTEGGWDRPRDHARTLGERDGKDKPLAEGNNDDNNEYGKDGNILNDDDEYAVGIDGVDCPLTRATMSVIFSALPPRERSLRVSGQACPHAESIILSVGSIESMMLSARDESIILSAPPTESMILSQRHPRTIMP